MLLACERLLRDLDELVVIRRIDVFEAVGVLIVGFRVILPRILGCRRAMRWLLASKHVLNSLGDDNNQLLCLSEALVLVNKALVN